MDYLRGIATFVRAAQAGSFSATARQLQVTPQAVSSQVAQLEQWLGVRLFNRSTRRISLTVEGQALFDRCKHGMDAIDEGVRSLRERNEDAAGTVRLAVPHGLSQSLVAAILPGFFEAHPRVTVDLVVENAVVDAVDQGIDIGLVGGSVPLTSLVARRITTFQLVLCASKEYLRTHGTPKTVADLRRHRCVNLRSPRTGKNQPWTFRRHNELVTIDLPGSLTVNDTESHRRAVLHGAGVGQLASFFVAPHVRSGELTPLLLGHVADPIDLFLYLPNRAHVPRKTRLLADFLVDTLRSHPDMQPWVPLQRAQARKSRAPSQPLHDVSGPLP